MTITEHDKKTICNGIGWYVIILAGMRLGYHVQGLAEKIAHAVLYEDFQMAKMILGIWNGNPIG